MKSVDVKSNECINSSKENNDKDPKFKIGYIVRLLQYKSIFAKGYTQVGLKKFLWLKKLKKLHYGYMFLVILTEKKLGNVLQKRIGKHESKRVYSWKSNKGKRW